MTGFFFFLYLLLLFPKWVWTYFIKGKKLVGLWQRLGGQIPASLPKKVIWIHGVSVGEIKAAQPLYLELKKEYPEHAFVITTTTLTGQQEAKRSLKGADLYAFLPFDFKWLTRLWVKRLKPKLFLLVESDFWPNLLHQIERGGGKNILLNGKLSERSARRFGWVSFFSKRLFNRFSLLCVQSEEYRSRFLPLVSDPTRLHVTGNLKLDLQAAPIPDFWVSIWKQATTPFLTLSCTHPKEEELLLSALQQGSWNFFLVPRHPERFLEVEKLLEQKDLSFIKWSDLLAGRPYADEKVVLVDAMGQLPICYHFSRLAIVAGSYIETVGGHNILEPCLYGVPVFFGPHMFSQKELVRLALQAKAGKQVDLAHLRTQVERFFLHPQQQNQMREAALHLMQSSRGATQRTLQLLKSVYPDAKHVEYSEAQ